jgi:hypothetical protein
MIDGILNLELKILMKKKISIVTPTFNEEKNILKLCDEISKEMKNIPVRL